MLARRTLAHVVPNFTIRPTYVPPPTTTTTTFLWPPCVADADIIFLPCGFFFLSFFFLSSPNRSRRRLDVCHTCTHGVTLVRLYAPFTRYNLLSNRLSNRFDNRLYRVNGVLECRSETCCTRLADNTGRKKSQKFRHLGAITQLCRAISSQVRHISTIGKKLVKQQYLLYMSSQYGELRLTTG